jgi:DNA-binding response OmpR family regulator
MRRIIVVEDDPHLRRIYRNLLENEGFEVYEAEDGFVGLEMIRALRPDCVVTDTMMPRMDGMGMLSHLAAEGLSTPVIMVSAVHELPDQSELQRLGVVQTFGKPFPFDQLVEAVRSHSGEGGERGGEGG